MFKRKQTKQAMARKLIVRESPKSIYAEQYRAIRTSINFSMPDKDIKTIVVTSPKSGEGKSTISANLAGVFSQEGKNILLVDADMRKPTVHYTFNLMNSYGLSEVLSGQYELRDAIQDTYIEGLYVLPSGSIPPNPAELLNSKRMNQLLFELKAQFDFIFFDTPPILSVTDSQILANKCDATILVINSRQTPKELASKSKSILQHSKSNIIGVILNNYILKKNDDYYSLHGYIE
ncbi:CpsD/CapB family tyrosine-protein kinase [Ureibacillus sp. BA0131]|uniref:non-specific protein-tyrosine kinase n=1 Tax=Ureibacillus aquaedulcis TaxID=3058421 RepID=A0ABT8GUP5_9BACL|nr:CpsD/CapB family tyrosine-protein kinase [Ureibacillus sp. BA0131]MDN4495112.1 CpsD/CapB family tyrosine-protein kinase [Ureibacillus sp. BA0131]